MITPEIVTSAPVSLELMGPPSPLMRLDGPGDCWWVGTVPPDGAPNMVDGAGSVDAGPVSGFGTAPAHATSTAAAHTAPTSQPTQRNTLQDTSRRSLLPGTTGHQENRGTSTPTPTSGNMCPIVRRPTRSGKPRNPSFPSPIPQRNWPHTRGLSEPAC
jgi:hypothetical protein